MIRQLSTLDSNQKALDINLDEGIYGTFAEIGAGQEVARRFFKVGAAAGTIAKSMSAYDKTYSDSIYGVEKSGRYVCQSRLYNMLDHEYALMIERLSTVRPDDRFFVYADTVSTINYQKTNEGHGWMGVRFQMRPGGPSNDIILHVRMKDRDATLQQDAIGILGVNLIYAAFFYSDNFETFIKSLYDELVDRLSIDLIEVKGPDFEHIDNRVLALYLTKHGLSQVAMFSSEGKPMQASEFLYRKALMVVRGNFSPPTIVTKDVFDNSWKQFIDDYQLDVEKAKIMAEIPLQYLYQDGKINVEDFIARADMLKFMGYDVIVSNYPDHQKLVRYLAPYKIPKLGLVIGVKELDETIHNNINQETNDNVLVTFGRLFTKNIKVYVYPATDASNDKLYTADNMEVDSEIYFLYRYLIDRGYIEDVTNYNRDNLDIYSYNIRQEIKNDSHGWEAKLPEGMADLIKKHRYFGYGSA